MTTRYKANCTALMRMHVSKIYPACHTDVNGIKPGSNLNNADKRLAEPSGAEFFGIKNLYSIFE